MGYFKNEVKMTAEKKIGEDIGEHITMTYEKLFNSGFRAEGKHTGKMIRTSKGHVIIYRQIANNLYVHENTMPEEGYHREYD